MSKSTVVKLLTISLFSFFIQVSFAESTSETKAASAKVSYRAPDFAMQPAPKVPNSSELVFSAPPRESAEEGSRLYGPVAEYLSRVTGKKIVYKFAGNWGVYQGTMQHGGYDLVFDGPHFNGWRISKIQHNVLVKVPGDFVFVTVVKKENNRVQDIKQLAGYTVCGHAPPNLGTLTVLEQFSNPARQPIIISIDGWRNIYDGLIAGKCSAAVVPLAKLEQFEKSGAKTKIIYRAKALPDNAFSAGPRLTADDQSRITQALLSPEGTAVTAALRQKYAGGKAFVPTSNNEYASLGEYLRNEWGYY